jgi:hypothetical protein
MMAKKKTRGRPVGSGSGRQTEMLSRRIDADLWRRFRDYVETIVPRTSDTAVLELAIEQFLERNSGDPSRGR